MPAMHADKVEVSWDTGKSNWLVRILSGEEVIRRQCKEAKTVDDNKLRSAALATAKDEGYDVDASVVSIKR
jgi:hypothetical protein